MRGRSPVTKSRVNDEQAEIGRDLPVGQQLSSTDDVVVAQGRQGDDAWGRECSHDILRRPGRPALRRAETDNALDVGCLERRDLGHASVSRGRGLSPLALVRMIA